MAVKVRRLNIIDKLEFDPIIDADNIGVTVG